MSEPRLKEIAGRKLEYAWIGRSPPDKPTILFLHEGLGSVGLWRDFPGRIAATTGLAVLAYSRAGYGRSDPAPLPRPVGYMHDEAQTVLPAVLDAFGIQSAILVGHSDGASIALIHAALDIKRRRIKALVLEAPHVFTEPSGLASIAAAKVAYETGDLRARLERHHGANVDNAFRGWNDIWLHPDFTTWNIEEYLPRVIMPTLVIQGADDEYGTLAQVEAIEQQSSGPVERLILPECRHSPHRDQPAATLRAIKAFVAKAVG
jgi:pimeloyl-ACP methyl ester carboxylesterase